jgi:hypothetical protein
MACNAMTTSFLVRLAPSAMRNSISDAAVDDVPVTQSDCNRPSWPRLIAMKWLLMVASYRSGCSRVLTSRRQ